MRRESDWLRCGGGGGGGDNGGGCDWLVRHWMEVVVVEDVV